jgi:tetratricopeptide (TPR) repeat protein
MKARRNCKMGMCGICGLSLALLAALGFLAHAQREVEKRRACAEQLAEAVIAPRHVYSGHPLGERTEDAVLEIAARHGIPALHLRKTLDEFASGDWLGRPRTGYGEVLAHLAAQRFELAIASARSVAHSPIVSPRTPPRWRLLTLAGVLELGNNRPAEAQTLLDQAFEAARQNGALESTEAVTLLTALGTVRTAQGKLAEGEPFLRRAMSLVEKHGGIDPRDHARVLTHLAQAIAAQGFPEEAEPLCAKAFELSARHAQSTGRADRDLATFETNYRRLLRERGLIETEIEQRIHAALP